MYLNTPPRSDAENNSTTEMKDNEREEEHDEAISMIGHNEDNERDEEQPRSATVLKYYLGTPMAFNTPKR